MTVNTTDNRVSYTGNGTIPSVPVPFYFLEDGDLTVLEVVIATGVQTPLDITTDYTVSGAGDPNGGTVTGVAVLPSTKKWVIYRDPDLTQTVQHVDNDPLSAESINNPLDKGIMIAQRLSERIDRSLRQPDGDADAVAALPAKVDRASRVLAFDADGDPEALALTDIGTSVLSDDTPQAIGTAAAGTSEELSRADHVHALSDGSVTLAKLANLVTQRLIGRNTGSTGVPEAVTIEQIFDWIAGTAARGDIFYRGASGVSRLAKGTAGHVLTQGADDPAWAAPTGGGLILLDTKEGTADQASVEFLTGIDGTYDEYLIKGWIKNAAEPASLYLTATTDGGSSYLASTTYTNQLSRHLSNASSPTMSGDGGAAQMTLASSIALGAQTPADVEIRIKVPANTSFWKPVKASVVSLQSSGVTARSEFAGWIGTTSAINGLKLAFSSGNVDEWSLRLYGVKTS